MSTKAENKQKSYGGLSVVFGILSIILTVSFSSMCVILDLLGKISKGTAAGLVFVGLIFGIIGIFTSCISNATVRGNKAAVFGLVCSIISILLCVYSFILYLDMCYWWTNILTGMHII